jgi:peptide/nickel transport system permease protein
VTDSAKPDVFLRRNHVALIGLSVLLLLALIAWIAPSLTLHDPAMLNLRARLRPPVWLEGGSWAYPLGTDQLGRDVASRLIAGARISLLVGLAVVLIAGGFGVLVGLVSGYFGGRLDQVLCDGLMRISPSPDCCSRW